jgi:hypothetical protein
VRFATTAGTLLVVLSILGLSWCGFNFAPVQKNLSGVLTITYEHLPIPPIISTAVADRRNWSSRDRDALQNGLMYSAFTALHLHSRANSSTWHCDGRSTPL